MRGGKFEMLLLSILLFFITFSLVLADPTARNDPHPAPPAGRALLSRGADLEPHDYPASLRSGFDPHLHIHPLYPVLGPPSFWTYPSLHSHYLANRHLRYHPLLYPHPPPFDVWLKEQQLIRSISLLSQTIELETSRHVDFHTLLQHEMQLGELSVLLRYTQIATALRYASLAPEWRKFEESMYRHWGSFLQVNQGEVKKEASTEEAKWRDHLAYLELMANQEAQEGERKRETAAAERDRNAGGSGWREIPVEKEEEWRNVPVERGMLQSSTPKRWTKTPDVVSSSDGGRTNLRDGLETAVRWDEGPWLPPIIDEDAMKGIKEAFEKGSRHV